MIVLVAVVTLVACHDDVKLSTRATPMLIIHSQETCKETCAGFLCHILMQVYAFTANTANQSKLSILVTCLQVSYTCVTLVHSLTAN